MFKLKCKSQFRLVYEDASGLKPLPALAGIFLKRFLRKHRPYIRLNFALTDAVLGAIADDFDAWSLPEGAAFRVFIPGGVSFLCTVDEVGEAHFRREAHSLLQMS